MRTGKALTEHFGEMEYEHIHFNEKLSSVLKNGKGPGSKLDAEIKNIEAFQFKPSDTYLMESTEETFRLEIKTDFDHGFNNIQVNLMAHHLFFGSIKETDFFNWMKKVEILVKSNFMP